MTEDIQPQQHYCNYREERREGGGRERGKGGREGEREGREGGREELSLYLQYHRVQWSCALTCYRLPEDESNGAMCPVVSPPPAARGGERSLLK